MSNYNAAINYDAARNYNDVPTGFARYLVQVDWNNDGDYSDTNEDITDDVLEIKSTVGRNFASQLTGRASAGRLEVTVKNNTGKYSPFNASSALAGNLVPNRPIQWGITVPSTTTMWTGYIESIIPSVQKGPHTTAKIRAFGIFKKFATTDARVAMKTSRATGAAIGDVLDAVSWGAGLRTLDTGQTTMTRFFGSGKALKLMRQIEATEAGFIRETKDGKIAFEDRHHRLTNTTSKTSQATFADDGTGFSYTGVRQEDSMGLVYNEFLSPVSVFTVASVATLWTHPLATTSGTAPALEAGEVIEVVAEYPTPAAANNVVGVDAWTTLAATTDYLANAAANGTGTNYTSSLGITLTKAATTMVIQITNNAAVKVYLTKLQARGTAVSVSDPGTVKSNDATSQTAYGLRTFPRGSEAKWIPTQEEAQNWTLQNLSAHKDPTAILTLQFSANQSGDGIIEAVTRDVSDRVTVKASANAKLGLNRDFYIESIRHHVKAGGAHTTTYGLSDTAGFAGFWVIGTSALGQDTRITY